MLRIIKAVSLLETKAVTITQVFMTGSEYWIYEVRRLSDENSREFWGVEVHGSWDDKVGRHQVPPSARVHMPSFSRSTSDAQDMLQEKQLRRFNLATLRAFEEHLALDATEW